MFAYYRVEWYDEEPYVNQGFVQGDSFAEVAQKIEEDYGNVEAMDLRWISDSSQCLDLEEIEDFFNMQAAESGAGPQVFEAIKQGLQEAIDGNYEEDLQE